MCLKCGERRFLEAGEMDDLFGFHMTHLRQLKCFESRPAANFVPDQGCEAGGLNLLWQPGSLAASGCVRHASSSQPTGLSSRRMAGIAVQTSFFNYDRENIDLRCLRGPAALNF